MPEPPTGQRSPVRERALPDEARRSSRARSRRGDAAAGAISFGSASAAATLLHVPRHASLVHFCALVVWTRLGIAGAQPCPRAGEPWVQVVFAGSAWSPALRDAVLRELGVELERRSLALCADPEPNAASVPEQRVTLLADDAQRIAIIPASLEHEGGFVGRTVVVGNIPEDARALAIAQAVDEALRSESARPSPSLLPPKPEPPAPAMAAPPKLQLGLALAPTLQVAPAA